MEPFVAIDFETANQQRASACAVGLARFDAQGELVAQLTTLLRPHSSMGHFHAINISVHGITPKDVEGAPEWAEIFPQVTEFMEDLPVIAHNMAFDGSVINRLAELYGLPGVENHRLCTLRLARKLLAGQLERNSLNLVFNHYFPGHQFAHHQAAADAIAAGQVFAQMQREHGYGQLLELCPPNGQVRRGNGSAVNGSRATQVDAQNLADLLQTYENSAAIRGEKICFTGKLSRGKRADLQELISVLGAKPSPSVTKQTTMLVVGMADPSQWAAGASASRKMAQAEKLRQDGADIRVLGEEQFFDLLRLG